MLIRKRRLRYGMASYFIRKVAGVLVRAVRRQKKGAKKGASYRRLRRLLRHLYIVDAVLEASGRQALLL
jgi:hypothetical protein